MSMKRAFLLCLAVCPVLLSCAPPFDPGLSQAAYLIRNMRLETAVGPMDWVEKPTLQSDARFMPVRVGATIDVSRGFIASSTKSGMSVWYSWDTLGGDPVSYAAVPDDHSWTVNLTDNYPAYPTCIIQTLLSGPAFIDLQIDPLGAGARINSVNTTMNPPEMNATISYDFTSSPIAIPAYVKTLGGHILPWNSGTEDRLYYLVRTASACFEVEAQVTSSGLVNPVSASISLPFVMGPPVMNRCLYFHNQNTGQSYAEALMNGAWKCWTWSAGAPVEVPGITKRLSALLTTGELFSVDGGVATVYAGDGTMETSFPMGALRFVSETYVDGSPRALFSLMTEIDRSVTFYLYSIPTADLAALR